MPEVDPHSRRIAASLAHRVGAGADATRIAREIVTALAGIEANLSPIIGKGGVVALYRRSLHLVGPIHPGLAGSDSSRADIDLAALEALLAGQSAADAAEAGAALLQAFSDLLVSLVGLSLGSRLLQSVWENFPLVPPATDTTSP